MYSDRVAIVANEAPDVQPYLVLPRHIGQTKQNRCCIPYAGSHSSYVRWLKARVKKGELMPHHVANARRADGALVGPRPMVRTSPPQTTVHRRVGDGRI